MIKYTSCLLTVEQEIIYLFCNKIIQLFYLDISINLSGILMIT